MYMTFQKMLLLQLIAYTINYKHTKSLQITYKHSLWLYKAF